MRITSLSVISAFLGLGITSGQILKNPHRPNPARASTRLQLVVTVERPSVKLGDPVVLHAHNKNVSPKTVRLGTASWHLEYGITVTDASGAELPRTAAGERWLKEQQVVSTSSIIYPNYLEPGAEGKDLVVDAAMYYQFSRPGTYFIRMVYWGLWRDPDEPIPTEEQADKVPLEQAVSNVVQVTITP